jgi:hypothetical protein
MIGKKHERQVMQHILPIPEGFEYDDDTAVWDRIMLAVYGFHGNWKKWLPYYGPREVQEITVRMPLVVELTRNSCSHPLQFKSPGHKDCNQAYYVDRVETLNIDDLRQAATSDSGNIDDEDGNSVPLSSYCSQLWHGDACPENYVLDEPWQGCIAIKAQKAEEMLDKLDRLYAFKICARRPHMAQGWQTLGLAQKSCLYDWKYVQ